ncbi:RNA polymerase sigma factor [Larkinella sp. VNQ87]|uniref:RNA polymerase sigma factor n=1 Tax=Larkinella sp. VNQ87 TaxID=3400921 RepID=UPI003BFFF481
MTITQGLSIKAALLTDRALTLERIYAETFPMVRHYVREHGGSDQDAKDVFQEAIITFYEQTVHENRVLTSSVRTYLMGICKNRWRQELTKRARKSPLTATEADTVWTEPEDDADRPPLKLMTFVEQLGETCKSILVSFYYFGQHLEQIATQHGYRNVRTATVQKFKCLERLRKAVGHLTIDHFNS